MQSLPVEGVVDDDGFGDDGGVVARVEAELSGSGAGVVGEKEVIGVAELAGDGFGVGIKEELRFIEAEAPPGMVVAADFIAVELAGFQAADEGMPDEAVAVAEGNDVGWIALGSVKQEEEDLGGVPRVDSEVDSGGGERGSEGESSAFFDDSGGVGLERHDGSSHALIVSRPRRMDRRYAMPIFSSLR